MPNYCEAITATGVPCIRRANNDTDGFHFCGQHLGIYIDAKLRNGGVPRPADRCHVISGLRNFCPYNCAPDDIRCQRHLPPDLGGPQEEIVELFGWGPQDIADALANPNVRIRGFEDWGIPAPVPGEPVFVLIPPVVPFAADPQNVHRKEVSEQTNKATEFLMNIPLPKRRRDELWKLAVAAFVGFVGANMQLFVSILADMEHWVNTDSCRKKDDHLYRELLYRLIVYIQKSEHKKELFKRLYEECCDAVGMCCEGHISRLCNVLVGYVEGLDAPVSLGELTQQKMAAIAGQDIPEEDKKRQANEFFDKHGVPAEERAAWLDAF